MSNTAERILSALKDADFTFAQLESKTGISKSSLQRYASANTHAIPADKIVRVAEALRVPTDFLLCAPVFSCWEEVNLDRAGFLDCAKSVLGDELFRSFANYLYDLYPEYPDRASISDFTYFIYDNFESVSKQDGMWRIIRKRSAYKEAPGSTEGLSPDRQALIDLVLHASDEEVRVLRGIVDQVLSLRGK